MSKKKDNKIWRIIKTILMIIFGAIAVGYLILMLIR